VPFFSKNLFDFWQRWHISLTTWIKEYLYYPLALAKIFGRKLKAPLVIMLTWAIMGFWHGASWKFVLWGVYHGAILIIYSRIRPYLSGSKLKGRFSSGPMNMLKMLLVFHLFAIGMLFFAVNSAPEVIAALSAITRDIFSPYGIDFGLMLQVIVLIAPLLLMEYFQYKSNDELVIFNWPTLTRGVVYFLIFYFIIFYGDFGAERYYYFQF